MIDLQLVGTEVSALGAVALSMPLRLIAPREMFDPDAPCPTPVVFVHGLFGDPTNFLLTRSYLAAGGVRNFATFSYPPRFDYQRLARRLGAAIADYCAATGVDEVDIVGHSMGGMIARYLVEMDASAPVRRLVTLGAPYFASPMPPHELAIFGACDFFIPPPHPHYGPHAPHLHDGGRAVIIPHCGHWGLLYHSTVMQKTATFLTSGETTEVTGTTLALEAAS